MWARKHIRCQCVYQPTQATEPAASLALAVVILMLMFRQISFWLEKACSKELVLFTGGNLLGAFLSQEYAQFIARGRNLPRNQFESTIFQSIYQLMFPHKGTHVLPNTHTHTHTHILSFWAPAAELLWLLSKYNQCTEFVPAPWI